MSKFVSLHILASIVRRRSKTPAPPVVEQQSEPLVPGERTREEPPSASRIRVNRVRVEG
jgi:hypothetical protein